MVEFSKSAKIAKRVEVKVRVDDGHQRQAMILIPKGTKSVAPGQIIVKDRFNALETITAGSKKIDKHWITTLADTTIFLGAILNALGQALRSFTGVGVVLMIVFAIYAVVRIAR